MQPIKQGYEWQMFCVRLQKNIWRFFLVIKLYKLNCFRDAMKKLQGDKSDHWLHEAPLLYFDQNNFFIYFVPP